MKKFFKSVFLLLIVVSLTFVFVSCAILGGEDGTKDKGNKYTITFNTNGGESFISSQEYSAGAQLNNLPTPTRSGYDFMGWKDEKGNEYNSSSTMPEANITLIAQWTKSVSTFEDNYLKIKPAKKVSKSNYDDYPEVQECIVIELTSDDLGGMERVGEYNNFDMIGQKIIDVSVTDDYTLLWYEGNWNNLNGSQMFTLDYGSNIQLVTVSQSQQVVKRYLVNIYVKYDYYVDLYKSIRESNPYDSVRVIEGELVPTDIEKIDAENLTYREMIYYDRDERCYLPYDFSSPVNDDLALYQNYEDVEVKVVDDSGNYLKSLNLTPYMDMGALEITETEGYDFIGYKLNKNGTEIYFAESQGYTCGHYLGDKDEYFDTLVADLRPIRYYQYFDSESTNVLHVQKLIPVVVFTTSDIEAVSEIIYVPEGGKAAAPSAVPVIGDRTLVVGWEHYEYTTYLDWEEKKWCLTTFDFTDKIINESVSIFPETEKLPSTTDFALSAGMTRELDAGDTGLVQMFAPCPEEYTLVISATEEMRFTVNSYMDKGAETYTVKGGETVSAVIDFTDGGFNNYASFIIDSAKAPFTIKLEGSTASTSSSSIDLNGEKLIEYGEEALLLSDKEGYAYKCTDEDGNEIWSYIDEWKYLDGQDFVCNFSETKPLPATITFDSQGGDAVASITQEVDTEIVLPTPVRDGYYFIGWFTDPMPVSFNQRFESEKMPLKDTVLYAGWADAELHDDFYYEINGNEITVTGRNYWQTDLVIPSEMFGLAVTAVSEKAFYNDTGLVSLTIPATVTEIGKDALAKTKMKNIEVSPDNPNYKTSNGVLFSKDGTVLIVYSSTDSTSLQYQIPESVTMICDYAFSGFSSMEITIPDSVVKIGRDAFKDLSIASCTTVNGVIYAGKWVIDCTSDAAGKITLEDGTVGIADYAFGNATEITSIVLSESVKYIGDGVFNNCGKLTTVNCNATSEYINVNGVLYSADSKTLIKAFNVQGEFSVPATVTKISGLAFEDCDSLTKVIIHKDVTEIGEKAFSGCTAIESFVVDSNNPNYSGFNGSLYSKDMKTLIKACDNGSEVFTTPSGVTTIADAAFDKMICYNTIVISSGVTKIGEEAFWFATVNSLALPDSIKVICENAFYFSNIENLYISNIGKWCTIRFVNSQSNPVYRSSNIYLDGEQVTSVAIPEGVESISAYAFYGWKALTNVTLPDSLEIINKYVFGMCENLESIVIPEKVTYIGQNAFLGTNTETIFEGNKRWITYFMNSVIIKTSAQMNDQKIELYIYTSSWQVFSN